MFNNNGVVNGAYLNHIKRVPELNNRISQISDNNIKRRGYNKLYMEEVTQANEGVDFKFLK